MKIGIIGAGYVGKGIGDYFLNKRCDVLFYDINPKVVDKLKQEGLQATKNIEYVAKRRFIFVSVPTPTNDDGTQELSMILSAVKNLAKAVIDDEEHIIIIKSTIVPGTTESVILPEIYKHTSPQNVGIIYSPEFLTEIHNTWVNDESYKITPINEHRLVIGEGKDKRWGNTLLKELYSDVSVPVIRTDYKTAEMIKYASNNALAARISYWNEVFLVCQELGIDSNIVAKAASLDPRIGVYGTVHGKAFGGKCLPKDLKAFINFAEKYREVPLHRVVLEINEYMKRRYGVRE